MYDKAELQAILSDRGLTLIDAYSDYDGSPDSDRLLQLMVYSKKRLR
jgi:hypothetical protein